MSQVNTSFYRQLAQQLDVPYNKNFLRFAKAWQAAEGGSASYNPFNTTQPAGGASNYNSVGVKNYTSQAQGVRATAQTLENGHYDAILAALRRGTPHPAHVATLVGESPWGTSGSLIRKVLGAPETPSAPAGGKKSSPNHVVDVLEGNDGKAAPASTDMVGDWITSHLVIVIVGLIILVLIVKK